MTIASTVDRVQYTGNGATSTYSYTFKIFNEADLLVTRVTTADVETTLTLNVDYTVTGVGETGGGTIVLADGNLTSGYILVIRRKLSILQSTDLRNQGQFYASTHEDQFDKFTMIDQQQQNELDRSIKLPEGVDPTAFDATLPQDFATPADVLNRAIVVDSAGTGLAIGPTANEISAAQGYAASVADAANRYLSVTADPYNATGDGSTDDTTAFQAWANDLTGGAIGFVPPLTYKLNSQITFPSDAVIIADGATFDFGSASGTFTNNAAFYFAGTGLTSLPALAADVAYDDRNIVLASAPSISAGDIVMLYDTADYSYSGFRTYYRAGEMLTVRSVSGSTITVTTNPYAEYSYGSTVSAFKVVPTTVRLRNFNIIAPSSGSVTAITIRYGKDCVLEGLNLSNSGYAGLSLTQCYNTHVSNCRVSKLDSAGSESYGIICANSQRLMAVNSVFEGYRHGVSNGGGDYTGCIPNRDITYSNCIVTNGNSGGGVCAFDVHGNTEHITVMNCVLNGGANPGGNHNVFKENLITHNSLYGFYFSEMLGFDHVISGNKCWFKKEQDSNNGYFIDIGGSASNLTSNTTAGGTLIIENNYVDYQPISSTASAPGNIYIRNRGCTQSMYIRMNNNVMRRPYDSTYLQLALELNIDSGSAFKEIEICGNSINGMGLRIPTCALYVKMDGNKIIDSSAYGVIITGPTSGTVLGVDFNNNFIRGSKQYGFYIIGGAGNYFPVINARHNTTIENCLVTTGNTSLDQGMIIGQGTVVNAYGNYSGGTGAAQNGPARFVNITTLYEARDQFYGTGSATYSSVTNSYGSLGSTNADTSGASLATLETEVNQIKASLRNHLIIAT